MTTSPARTTPRSPVLRDDQLDAELATRGYVVVPLLSSDEVAELRAAYEALRPEGDDGLVIDFMREDRATVRGVTELLAPMWERHLPDVFVDRRIAVSTFITKYPGPDSAMGLHDEPSFVDERSHRSYVVWIPLVDVGPGLDNGALLLLAGSAQLDRGLGGYNTPVHHRPYAEALVARMVAVDVRAGDAVVYDTRTLHASGANLGAEPRPAISASAVPAGVPLVHVVATGRRHRRIHRVPDDFYVEHHPLGLDLLGLDLPVVDEFDETARLDVDALARLAGFDDAAGLGRPSVLVPPDLAELVGTAAPEPFAVVGRVASSRSTDLAVAAEHLVDLPDDAHPATGPAHAAHRLAEAEAEALGLRGAILVLDPGGRLTLRCPAEAGADPVLEVIECPLLASGLAAPGRAGQLDVGERLALPTDEDLVLWHQGPGQLIVSVGPDAGPDAVAAAASGSGRHGALGALRRILGRRERPEAVDGR